MEIYATERFLRAYRKAHITLQKQAESKVLHFVDCERAAPGLASAKRDQLEGVPGRVIEVELGGAPRLLLHYEGGRVTLLDVGGHEVTEYYGRKGNLKRDLGNRVGAPQAFLPGRGVSLFSPCVLLRRWKAGDSRPLFIESGTGNSVNLKTLKTW